MNDSWYQEQLEQVAPESREETERKERDRIATERAVLSNFSWTSRFIPQSPSVH
jgi:hypothetical protein